MPSRAAVGLVAAVLACAVAGMIYSRSQANELMHETNSVASEAAVESPPSPPQPGKKKPIPAVERVGFISKAAPNTTSANVRERLANVGSYAPNNSLCFLYKGHTDRCAPLWVIIGALKCGTTSVYSYLGKHPSVSLLGPMKEDEAEPDTPWAADLAEKRPLRFKEIGFFMDNGAKDLGAYLRYFPHIAPDEHKTTGEGSVQYVFSVQGALGLSVWMPHARLILLLRDPVERLFSRYQHTSSLFLGRGDLATKRDLALLNMTIDHISTSCAITVTEALSELMLAYIEPCMRFYLKNDIDISIGFEAYSKLMRCWLAGNSQVMGHLKPKLDELLSQAQQARMSLKVNGVPPAAFFQGIWTTLIRLKAYEHSMFFPQVRNFLNYFTQDQLLIVRSEDLFEHASATMARITKFIGLPPIDWDPICASKYNARRDAKGVVTVAKEQGSGLTKYPFIPAIRKKLELFYHPYNEMLSELVGFDFAWRYDSVAN